MKISMSATSTEVVDLMHHCRVSGRRGVLQATLICWWVVVWRVPWWLVSASV
jgi:hypothetical protein